MRQLPKHQQPEEREIESTSFMDTADYAAFCDRVVLAIGRKSLTISEIRVGLGKHWNAKWFADFLSLLDHYGLEERQSGAFSRYQLKQHNVRLVPRREWSVWRTRNAA